MGEVIVLSSDEEDIEISFMSTGMSAESLEEPAFADISPQRASPPPWKNIPRVAHSLSESDSSVEEMKLTSFSKTDNMSDDDELPDLQLPLQQTGSTGSTTSKADLNSDFPSNSTEAWVHPDKINKKRKNCLNDIEKRKRKLESLEKQEQKKKEAAFSKALKQASADIERLKRPGECLKWVTIILDSGLLHCDFSGDLLTTLRAADLQYLVEEAIIPCSISWERTAHAVHTDNDNMMVKKTETVLKEESVLLVWTWDKVIHLIQEGTLLTSVKEVSALNSLSKITLIIYGLEDYFRFQKTQKRRDVRARVLGSDYKSPSRKEIPFASAGVISRGDVELALAELQVLLGVCHRTINSKTELGTIICQFSKALAESPYKKEKSLTDELEWFATADSCNGIAVDKDGRGASRLWQQQLCQFNLTSLETSEAIVSVYPSPLSLINAYKECTSSQEAELLLQNINVRRGPGPLSSTRRIGPQLSKKIHKFFSSINGDDPV